MINLEDIVDRIGLLEPVPPVATQLLALAEDSDSSIAEIADLLMHDPALTANQDQLRHGTFARPHARWAAAEQALGGVEPSDHVFVCIGYLPEA